MGLEVAVVVATFGDEQWSELARTVAAPSAELEAPAELYLQHGSSLAEARNAGAARARAPWLLFLDASDEIEPGYLAAMAEASGELRAPSVRYVTPGAPELPAPVTFEGRHIGTLNPCAIGTLVPRELFERAGGFWPERAWEDWSLFRRCWLLGAQIEHVPRAVYRAHVDPAGRNSTVARREQLHREIRRAHATWIRKIRTQTNERNPAR